MSETVTAPVDIDAVDNSIKLFVGNLSYNTTTDTLREELSSVGNLVSCDVVVRQFGKVSRPLGYGFVSYATQEEADACVEKYNKMEFEGRELNVEVAKERVPKAGATKSRKGRKGRKVDGDEGAAAEGKEEAAPVPKAKRERKKREKRTVERTESQTLVYITNLPFSMDDEELNGLFSKFTVVSANLVKRPTGRLMGYGFVDLASHDEQAKAIAAVHGTTFKGRELSVKVALEKVAPPPQDAEEAPAPTTAQ